MKLTMHAQCTDDILMTDTYLMLQKDKDEGITDEEDGN